MDALVIHAPGAAARASLTSEPLLEALSLVGRLRAEGWSADVEDGSFQTLAEVEGRLGRPPRPRMVWLHAPRGARGLERLLRALKEEDLVVGAFGGEGRSIPRALLDAGADVVATSVAAATAVTERLGLEPWSAEPARAPAPEVLLEVPGAATLDGEGALQWGLARPPAPEAKAWRLAFDGVDLERHLDATRARAGQRVLPYVAAPGATSAAGAFVARACVELARAHALDELRFVDDDLARDRSFALALAEALAASGFAVPWTARVSAHRVDQPLLEAMRRAGCREVSVAAHLAATGPSEPLLDDARRVASAARRLGLALTLDLALGGARVRRGELELALLRLADLGPGRVRVHWRGPGALRPFEARLLEWTLGAARSGAAGPLRRSLAEAWRALRGPASTPGDAPSSAGLRSA